MARGTRLETLLFWLMALGGAAALVPCLVLPPWLEYQAQLQRRQAAITQHAAVERQVEIVEKQIDHLQNDPDYVRRLAEQGYAPRVEPPPEPDAAPDTSDDDATLLPELSHVVRRLMDRYPATWIFVDPRTRLPLMALGGALLVSAVILLGFGRRRVQAVTDSETPAEAEV